MPYKDKEKAREAYRRWYHKNKENSGKVKAQSKKRKKLIRNWFLDLKSKLSCSRCSENHSACLVFHHKDPSKKKHEISKMPFQGFGKKAIQEEMDKCEVLCANCHRKLHAVLSSLIIPPMDQ